MRRWYCNAMRESRSPPPFNEEPQISKDFWGFFVFSSRGSFSSPLVFASRWIFVCHADFADDADFFSLIIFLMNFHRFSLIFFFFLPFLYFADFDLSVWKDNADFSNSLFFLVGNHWILHIINPSFSRYLKFYRFRFISLLFYHFPHVSVR